MAALPCTQHALGGVFGVYVYSPVHVAAYLDFQNLQQLLRACMHVPPIHTDAKLCSTGMAFRRGLLGSLNSIVFCAQEYVNVMCEKGYNDLWFMFLTRQTGF